MSIGNEPALRQVDALQLLLNPDEHSVAPLAAATATAPIGESFGLDLGVWEMTAGSMDDCEVDESFIVLSGRATVHVHEDNGFPATEIELGPGTVARLFKGMRTTWIAHTSLRKIYLMPQGRTE
ncbi:cupin domain-containing protein [Arthrobacter sp. S2(2024)]|uniref:cupin domain-containing protein n=1 Tax=Arthrobacter sp. S2(2024) TaxID=3111911 RepID=UPI002FC661C1